MEYEVPLENRVINAFIRRKQDFLVKVMQGEDFQRIAKKAMFDIAELERKYCAVSSNPDVKKLAECLKNKLENSFSDDVEKDAIQYAHAAYISPDEHREEHENLLAGVVADDEGIERLEQAYQRSYAAVCRNYQAVARALALSMIKSPELALSRKMMETAIRNSFTSRAEFVAKEKQLADALSGYWQARLAVNDIDGDQEGFYISTMAIIANNAAVAACKMAAMLEADELYKA